MSETDLPKVLISGANGFVGCALSEACAAVGWGVRGAVRAHPELQQVAVGDIGPETDWRTALLGCEVVIHLAARVHVMHDNATDPLAAFRAVNTSATLNLARQAAHSGVRRFVFLSSIKVNGEATLTQAYRETDVPNPQDAYAVSKWEAEQGLHALAMETGMEVVILRPPLVYGPGVKANFLRLLRWVEKGVPLPLASVDNRRSMIYLGNLVDALRLCAQHPAAAGQTYLVSDGEDVSTAVLIRALAAAMGRPARLWPCPEAVLRGVAALAGKAAEADRLLGSLQIDSSTIRRDLGWAPPCTFRDGIQATVDSYRTANTAIMAGY